MTDIKPSPQQSTSSRIRAWGMLLTGFLCVGLFAFVVGPWLQDQIPTFSQIIQVVEDQDIDSGAYFYSEIKASYDGERYLLESMKLTNPDQVGLTFPFVFCIILCFVILGIGYRYLPME